MNGGLGVLLAALKSWSPLIGALITLIFFAGVNYQSLESVTKRVDRIEQKLDWVVETLKK